MNAEPVKQHIDSLATHKVKFVPNKGKPLYSNKQKKPKGMSGRQWKKLYKRSRRTKE